MRLLARSAILGPCLAKRSALPLHKQHLQQPHQSAPKCINGIKVLTYLLTCYLTHVAHHYGVDLQASMGTNLSSRRQPSLALRPQDKMHFSAATLLGLELSDPVCEAISGRYASGEQLVRNPVCETPRPPQLDPLRSVHPLWNPGVDPTITCTHARRYAVVSKETC